MFQSLRFLGAALAMAGALAADDQPRLSKYQRDSGQLMLKQVRRDVEELHYDRAIKDRKLGDLFDAASTRITQAQSNADVFRAIAGFTRALNDSHTRFQPPRRGFDFSYGWQAIAAGKWCLIRRVEPGSDAERQGLQVGDRLLAIDGAAVSTETLRAWRYLLTAIEPRQTLQLTVASPGEDPRTLHVATAIEERQHNLDLLRDLNVLLREQSDREQRGRNAFHEFDGVLVWRLKHFNSGDDITEGIRKIGNFDRVVLDLRGNGGGSVGQVLRLTAVLLGRDTPVGLRKTRVGDVPVVAELRREQPWMGKLMVLVDRQSGSGAELLASAVQQNGRGLLLGDRTAGAVQEGRVSIHKVGVERLVFFATMVAVAEIELPDGRRIEGVGVMPDFLMPLTDLELREKRDSVLAMALRQLGVTRRPEELAAVSWMFDPDEGGAETGF